MPESICKAFLLAYARRELTSPPIPDVAPRRPIAASAGASATLALLGLSFLLASATLAAAPLGAQALTGFVVAAFVAATLGGLLVALIARAPAEICAPASSTTVIYASLCADLVLRAGPQVNVAEVWASLSLAVVLMGLLLAIAGRFRLADAIKFLPSPVSAGFVTGIGLLVIWSQAGPLLGLYANPPAAQWPAVMEHIKPASIAVGAVTALGIWLYPRFGWRGQPALIALAAGTAIHHLLAHVIGAERLGPTLDAVEPMRLVLSNAVAAWTGIDLQWLLSRGLYVLPYAAFLALQAVMNAAVTSITVGSMLGSRSDANRTLKAQALANIVCGALGALPVSTNAALSVPAAKMPGGPNLAATSCVVLFTVVLVAGRLLTYVPVAVLAGILVMAGIGMIDRWAKGLATQVWRSAALSRPLIWNLGIVAAVAAAFFLGSVPLALSVGAVLAMVLLSVNLSAATTFASKDAGQLASTRVWTLEQAQWLDGQRRRIALFRPRGALFFGTADALARQLATLTAPTCYCALDLSRLTTMDATGCQMLSASARKLASAGIVTVLAGVDPSLPQEQSLIALGLADPPPQSHWFADLDLALEWVETRLLADQWPGVAADAPVDFADTPLTRGLTAPELAQLRSCMGELKVAAGPLFRRGDAAASMFVIDAGRVEIRIGDPESSQSTRLAAFGPGSIFGEVALLMSQRRTADAVCVMPTRLLELTLEAFDDLERDAPGLHTRIVRNLGVHLANRLVIATRIVQTQH